jgi:hypothetical protein
MATLTGPSVLSRITKEGRFLSHDGGRDVRSFSFARDHPVSLRHSLGLDIQQVVSIPDTGCYQHSGSRQSHSDLDGVPKYGLKLKASGEDADTPSIKVGLIPYLEEITGSESDNPRSQSWDMSKSNLVLVKLPIWKGFWRRYLPNPHRSPTQSPIQIRVHLGFPSPVTHCQRRGWRKLATVTPPMTRWLSFFDSSRSFSQPIPRLLCRSKNLPRIV